MPVSISSKITVSISSFVAKIDFIDFYKLYNSDVYLDQYDDYSVPNYYIDELAYFLSIYGDLMHFE